MFSCLLHGWYIVIILLKYMAHTLLLAKDMSRYKGASIKDVQGRGEGGGQPLPPTRIKIKNHQTSITKSLVVPGMKYKFTKCSQYQSDFIQDPNDQNAEIRLKQH